LRDSSASRSSNDNLLNRLLSEDRLLNLGQRNRLSLLVVIVGASIWIVVVSSSSGCTAIVVVVGTVVVIEIIWTSVEVVVVGEATAVKLLLEKNEDLLNELNGVGLLEEAGVDLVGGELFPLVVEVGLVLGLGLLLLADLGQLVVGHVQLLPVHGRSVELGPGDGGAIRLLEADECAARGLVVVRGQDLHALDLAELLEMLHQVLLVEFGREVLHEEVALLLRVLESLLLSLDHTLSLETCQRGLNVETIGVVKFIDSVLSCDESLVSVGLIEEAYEGELAFLVLGVALDKHGGDGAELAEHLSELGLVPGLIEVLHVYVVELILDGLRVLDLELNRLHRLELAHADKLLRVLLVLEAHETVAV
jgi:hypothetical protein